ncbi:MAG: LL-diaminopimelate aminotransferase [Eubacteriales bacterium]|nr:LL-diaminopimelate aminotransferase [Eubacteriales bacterium]MDD3882197.1 LL-diaminopimelate aminotransferase [Eubacteriales bacterium]MDD4512546.1 LL-diaminopimelate aminotransferase [Eubacteriales bacterium]
MIPVNNNYQKLPGSYLFAEVARRVKAYKQQNPDADVISLGIGDVTRPLCLVIIEAMQSAVAEMGKSETFRGYGPDFGYDFLVNAIRENDYKAHGVELEFDEVFISDGAKSDTGNFQELFGEECRVAVPNPVYPVYVDTNAMAGRAGTYDENSASWSRLTYLPCLEENGFVPELPKEKVDVIYLCYPNNPTGTVLTRFQLKKFVDYALENECVILYDAAYRAFVNNPDVPVTIYEIEGAKKVAVEFNSYSKTAGFTGTRCGYCVVPHSVMGAGEDGTPVSLNAMWKRRQSTKFNGVNYVVQRGAAAVYSPEGKKQTQEAIDFYLKNAMYIRESLKKLGLTVFGGTDAPYVWVKVPDGENSWGFFDKLLNECKVVCTPGSGFGSCGEGFIRLTAFNTYEKTVEACRRISEMPR